MKGSKNMKKISVVIPMYYEEEVAEKKRKDYVNYYKTLTNYYYNVEVKFIDQTKKIMNTYTEILNPLIDTLSLIARDNNFIEEIDSKKDTEKFSRT